jgi:spore coat polysaccharide biosynthesis protein SpsF
MLDVRGATVLARVLQRLQRAKLTGELLVATTHHPADEEIVAECNRLGVRTFRGEPQDVLDRYYRAAEHLNADVVIRITSDCPLIEPEVTDKTIQAFLDSHADYASNALNRTYPRGLDTEVMSFDTLARTWRLAQKPYERSHVTAYIYEHPGEFELLSVTGEDDYSWQRWTVDTPDDLKFIRGVYEHMDDPDDFSWLDVLRLLNRKPELLELNRHVMQKALQEG